MEKIEQFIKKVLLEITGEDISDNHLSLLDEELLDSMSILYLVSEIEDKFEIQIPMDEIVEDNFQNMESIVAYIKSKCENCQ